MIRTTLLLTCIAAALASGCASTRMMKQPIAGAVLPQTPHTADPQLSLDLTNVIVRDGPGSWARHANWDEYQLDLRNASGEPLAIDGIVVIDAFDTTVEPKSQSRALRRETRHSLRRYRDHGIKVRPGAPPAVMVAGGTVVATYGAAVVTVGTSSFLGGSGALVGAGIGIASGGVALIAVGVNNAIQTHRLDHELEHRVLDTHATLAAQGTLHGSVFFPITPTPKRIEVRYHAGNAPHTLSVPLDQLLAGMHIDTTQASATP